jgi:hypothetical protein
MTPTIDGGGTAELKVRRPLRLDLLDASTDPLYREAVLLTLYDPSRPRVPTGDQDFANALWRLRGDGLVDWNETTGQPAPVLSGLGWTLAERLARGA